MGRSLRTPRAKFAVFMKTTALALLASLTKIPDAPPTFLPTAAPIRSWKQATAAQLAGSRKASEVKARSRVAVLAEYSSMKVADLKALCKERGLAVSGTKAVLVSRLEEAEGSKAAKPSSGKAAPEKKPATKKAPAPKKEPVQKKSQKIEPGDRVMARYHRDDRMHPGIVLDLQDSETYLISWDEPDDNEPMTSCKVVEFLKKAKTPLEPGEKQIYHVGDKVMARFPEDNNFYDADLLELNDGSCKIKWKDPDGSPPTTTMPVHDIRLKRRAASAC
eukprot:TRINITY_DN85805_c0_g1_i1.p1 TRINITY_DN85805_c0_g1~~TRINITY_DN85805_c0_g1_i1.p1  ORF type:complete len:285 (-),score=77.19 TRINITY_DN85805_c0_g1_i1:22-849(-)